MFCWSYYQTIYTEIGRAPTKFRLPRAELDKLLRAQSEEEQKLILETFARDLPVVNRCVHFSLYLEILTKLTLFNEF